MSGWFGRACLAAAAALALPAMAEAAPDPVLAPTGALRAVFITGNPAQAVLDPATGQHVGVAVDLARALAKTAGAPLHFAGVQGVQGVIDAVAQGKADIGFLASDPSRAGPVRFSQVYLRNPQGLAAPDASPIRSVADIDKPGVRIGVLKGDSIALYLAREKPAVTLVHYEGAGVPETVAALKSGRIDAFAGNRLRLTQVVAQAAGLRLAPGAIMGVPQAIVVKGDNAPALTAVNRFLDEARSSGLLQAAIERAANGTEMEPAGVQKD